MQIKHKILQKGVVCIGIVEKIARSMEVPEAAHSVSKVTVISDTSVLIENLKGVLMYTPEEICIRLQSKNLSITGNGLLIEYMNDTGLSISGKISTVSFV